MEERRRVIVWTCLGCLFLVPMAVASGMRLQSLGITLLALCLLLPGLVLLGMGLTGALRLMNGRRGVQAAALAVIAALMLAFLAMERADAGGQGVGLWGFAAFMALSYLLMGLWQVLLGKSYGGFLTESAYIDAAIVNLFLSILLVNALRLNDPWPDSARSLFLLLAFALVSSVMSLSALYSGSPESRGSRYWLKPVGFAVLLGLIMPFMGVLVMLMSQGFSVASM